MNDIEQRLFDILTTIEQANKTTAEQQATIAKQQAMLDKTLKEIIGGYATLDKRLIDNVGQQTAQAVRAEISPVVAKEIKDSLTGGIKNAESYVTSLDNATNRIKNASKELDDQTKYKTLAMWGGAMAIFLTLIIVFIAFYVPSRDEIDRRRAEVAELKDKTFITATCGGKVCVKVKTDKCGYGDDKSYCVVATK